MSDTYIDNYIQSMQPLIKRSISELKDLDIATLQSDLNKLTQFKSFLERKDLKPKSYFKWLPTGGQVAVTKKAKEYGALIDKTKTQIARTSQILKDKKQKEETQQIARAAVPQQPELPASQDDENDYDYKTVYSKLLQIYKDIPTKGKPVSNHPGDKQVSDKWRDETLKYIENIAKNETLVKKVQEYAHQNNRFLNDIKNVTQPQSDKWLSKS